MRHEIESIIGEEYRYLAIRTRERDFLTQSEMSEELYMSESSYSDIETGVTGCVGTLTATLLLSMQDDPTEFLKRIEWKIAEHKNSEVIPL